MIPVRAARAVMGSVLALVVTLGACTGDEALPEPEAVESCDGLVDAGAQLVRAYARLLEQVRVEDLVEGVEIPELDELERVGEELDASVARLGCDPAEVNRGIVEEVGDLAAESPASALLLDLVRGGVVSGGSDATTPTRVATTTTVEG